MNNLLNSKKNTSKISLEYLQGKRIALIGPNGKSGKSVLAFFQQYRLPLTLIDEKKKEDYDLGFRKYLQSLDNVELKYIGENLNEASKTLLQEKWDLVLLSPGVARKKSYIKSLIERKIPVWSEIEFAYRWDNFPGLAITGTDGKSTTTALTAHILSHSGLKSRACGNIGLPYLDIAYANRLLVSEKTDNQEIYHQEENKEIPVIELSSYQLESMDQFQVAGACLLNIAEDHVDRYASMEEYLRAKLNIFQGEGFGLLRAIDWELWPSIHDYFSQNAKLEQVFIFQNEIKNIELEKWKNLAGIFYYQGDDLVLEFFRDFTSPLSFEDNDNNDNDENQDNIIFKNAEKLYFSQVNQKSGLSGQHNRENTAFALVSAFLYASLFWPYRKRLHLKYESVKQLTEIMVATLPQFHGLAHRFQIIGKFEGIEVVNDSKATTIQAAVKACFARPEKKVILIAGGRGKGSDFIHLAENVAKHIKAAVLIGETADEIKKSLKKICPDLPCYLTRTMHEAVMQCKELAANGDTVLLSPACASFDMYDNYEKRGEDFMKEVKRVFLKP